LCNDRCGRGGRPGRNRAAVGRARTVTVRLQHLARLSPHGSAAVLPPRPPSASLTWGDDPILRNQVVDHLWDWDQRGLILAGVAVVGGDSLQVDAFQPTLRVVIGPTDFPDIAGPADWAPQLDQWSPNRQARTVRRVVQSPWRIRDRADWAPRMSKPKDGRDEAAFVATPVRSPYHPVRIRSIGHAC
jgi:hypothetical protein